MPRTKIECGRCSKIAENNPYEPRVASAKYEVTIFEGVTPTGRKWHTFYCQPHFAKHLQTLQINHATLFTITRLR